MRDSPFPGSHQSVCKQRPSQVAAPLLQTSDQARAGLQSAIRRARKKRRQTRVMRIEDFHSAEGVCRPESSTTHGDGVLAEEAGQPAALVRDVKPGAVLNVRAGFPGVVMTMELCTEMEVNQWEKYQHRTSRKPIRTPNSLQALYMGKQ